MLEAKREAATKNQGIERPARKYSSAWFLLDFARKAPYIADANTRKIDSTTIKISTALKVDIQPSNELKQRFILVI